MPTLSSILVQRGAASMRAVEDAIARQVLHGGDLPTNLLELGAVSEPMLTIILAETFSLDPAPAGRLPAPLEQVLRVIPGDLAVRHGVFPLELKERTLVLATAEPLSNVVEDDLGFALDVSIKQLAAPLVRVRQAIAEHYGIPLDRRLSRLVAKLDGRRDPSPSAQPPANKDVFPLKPPRPISIPVPSFGTGVPSTHPGDEPRPQAEATQIPAIPQSALVPQGLGVPERPGTRTESLPAVPRASQPAPPAAPASAPPAPEAPPPPPSAEALPYVSKRPTVPGMPMIRPAVDSPDMSPPATPEVPPPPPAPARRKGPFTTERAEKELLAATTTDAVLEVFFTFAAQFFEYAALFVIHGDLAEGRNAAGPGAEKSIVTGIGVPLDLPSSLARVRERRAPMIGPLGEEGLDADLARDLQRDPSNHAVALVPLVVRNRTVSILYGDDGEVDVALSSLEEIVTVTGFVATAIERIARQKKLAARAAPAPAAEAPPPKPTASSPRLRGMMALAKAISPPKARVEREAAPPEAPPVEAPQSPVAAPPAEPAPAAEPAPPAAEEPVEEGPITAPPEEEQTVDETPSMEYQMLMAAAARGRAEPKDPKDPDEPPATLREHVEQLDPDGAEPPPEVQVVEPGPQDGSAETISRAFGRVVSDSAEPPAAAGEEEAAEPSAPEARHSPVPGTGKPARRGPAPLYAGRSKAQVSTLEPLPREPPPNATAWTSAPSPPPPPLPSRPPLSDRPIPREEEDDSSGETPLAAAMDPTPSSSVDSGQQEGHPSPLPSVIVDIGAEYASLLTRVIEGGVGSQEAFDELVRHGEQLIQPLMARFPGPLRVDRNRARAELPAASQCGPILELIVAIRRPALPFISGRTSSPDVDIRFWATHVLGELRYPEAANVLVPRLFDDDASVRRIARRSASALVSAGAAGAPILQGLDNITRNVEEPAPHRVLAIETMGEIRTGAMVPPLIAVLSDPSDDIGDAARRALLMITRQDFGRDAKRWQEWWIRNASRHRIEWLMDALMHEQPSLRRAAGDELKLVTKEYFGYYDDLPKKERERAQSLYRAWWEREGRQRFG